MKNHTSIEPLEPRIAPATISIVGKTATWTDFDGDLVTMKWTSTDAPFFAKMDRDLGLSVSRILLDPVKHNNASITVTVKAAGVFGDGRVELGHLDGPGVALKSFNGPKAGISEIDLGNGVNSIGTLIMGSYGQTKIAFFSGAMGDELGEINGSTKVVKINGDITNGRLIVGGNSGTSTHGSISVAGNMRGDSDPNFGGELYIFGHGKSLTVGGNLYSSASILTSAGIGVDKVTILGDIKASNIYVSTSALSIRGSVVDGVITAISTKTILIGGSLVAQSQGGGTLTTFGNIGTITVKGSLIGTNAAKWDGFSIMGEADLSHAAAIVNKSSTSPASVKSISIGGSIISGTISNSNPAVNGGIYSEGNIGKLTIGGNIEGNSKTPVNILVKGTAPTTAGDYSAIGSITVKGSVTHAYIAAGTQLRGVVGDFMTGPQTYITPNPDAGIGSVKIGGDYIHSNIFAGVDDGGTFGVNNTAISDTLAVGDTARTAKIGAVAIKGHLLSDRDSGSLAGFAADVIPSITVNGRKVFTAGDGLRNFDTFITAREL